MKLLSLKLFVSSENLSCKKGLEGIGWTLKVKIHLISVSVEFWVGIYLIRISFCKRVHSCIKNFVIKVNRVP
jgi:hypothetical protein